MDIVSKLVYTPYVKSNQDLTKKIKQLIESMNADDADDTDVINYHTWAASKL